MKPDERVHAQMREEWNERAREDAHYYVAFGRRDQDNEEFFATGAGLVKEMASELKRLPSGKDLRALEIGCGPGRLLRPMSAYFAEIHGVDVSDEMVARARGNLAGVPNAFAQVASGSDLAMFPDAHFDFVYSYAVFQHIPSHEVVFSYLRETVRVLRPGGVARLQINGLPKSSKSYTTWEGVRVDAGEVREFAASHGIELLALTGVETQYMWTTWRKPGGGGATGGDATTVACPAGPVAVRAITNAFSGELAVPSSGRLACCALSILNLPAGADLNSLRVLFDGAAGPVCYVGPAAHNGLTQVNVFLPQGVRTGMLRVDVEPYGASGYVRVIPAGPSVPRLTAISDGVNLMSAQHIDSGLMKATIEEVDDIGTFAATVDDVPVTGVDTFRTDPLCQRWEVNFEIPKGMARGGHVLDVRLGKRLLTRMGILLGLAVAGLAAESPETLLRQALAAKTGSVKLPAGTIEVSREIVLPPDAHDLTIRGSNTTIAASAAFRGRALLVMTGGRNIKIQDLNLNGNRDAVGRMVSLPPAGTMYSRVLGNNGIVAEGVTGLEITQVKAKQIAGFAVLINGGKGARLTEIEVTESGGFNVQHKNNGMGGIALEEGASDFEIRRCLIGGVRGSAITLRGVERGQIRENELNVVARDGVSGERVRQVTIENNRMREIGFPTGEVDGKAVCVRLAGSVESVVGGNACDQTLLGAMVVGGERNRITGNHLTGVNIAHQDAAGIYLEAGSVGNVVEGNEVTGFRMGVRCVGAAPGVLANANKVGKNECSDEVSLAGLMGRR